MLSLTPLFAALAAWVAMREAIRLPVTIAMFLAFAGVALMVSDNYASGAWIGDILALGVPTLFAMVTVITRRHPGVDLLPAVCLAAIFPGWCSCPFPSRRSHGGIWASWLFSASSNSARAIALSGRRQIAALGGGGADVAPGKPFWRRSGSGSRGRRPGVAGIAGGVIVLAALSGLALADVRRGGAA